MKIGVLDSGYASYAFEKAYLKKSGFELEIFNDHFGNRAKKIEFARNKTGLFIRQSEIDKLFLDELPMLKAIVRYGIGYDNIDLEEAVKHSIRVANVQGYATYCVAEHTLSLILACLRSLPKGEEGIYDHYGKPPVPDIFELHHKTLGIIGLGRIGTRLAIIARGLFQNVIASDPYVPDVRFRETGVGKCSLPELLKLSHVISLHCTLTNETRNLIDHQAFGLMKKRPILINTARGPVINEMDLIRALKENQIHSAGIDVWTDEPITSRQKPVIDNPRVISTGHYAWYSDRSTGELQKRAAENMIALLEGRSIPDRLV